MTNGLVYGGIPKGSPSNMDDHEEMSLHDYAVRYDALIRRVEDLESAMRIIESDAQAALNSGDMRQRMDAILQRVQRVR